MPGDKTDRSWTELFDGILHHLLAESMRFYEDRLISLAVFGSVGRGAMRLDSDIDVLIVADPLPKGRLRRVGEFSTVESRMEGILKDARNSGIQTTLSPVFKTPAELGLGSPLLLDMVEDARILYDRGDFFKDELSRLRQRLSRLGARRIWKGNAWYWDLKPDYKCGEEFPI